MPKSKQLLFINVAVLLAVTIALRLVYIENIPGMNADEALHNMNVHDWLKGREAAWMMPTGRLASPIYCFLVLLCELLLPISFVTIRFPAFVSGIALIFVVYWVCLRKFGMKVAVVAALLCASSPIQIAYSRLGIEQALIGLWSIFFLHFLFGHRWLLSCLFLFIGMVVHPIDIFLLPMLLVSFGVYVMTSDWSVKKRWAIGGAVVSVSLLLLAGTFVYTPKRYIDWNTIAQNLTYPEGFARLLLYLVRALDGVTIYTDFVKPLDGRIVSTLDIGFGAVGFLIMFLGSVYCYQKKRWEELGYVVGLFLSLFSLWLLCGWWPLRVGVQRYSLFLIVPCLVLLGLLAVRLTERRWKQLPVLGSIAVGWIFVVCMWQFYFNGFMRTGGGIPYNPMYTTAAVEPKLLAYKYIVENARGRPATVITDSWWTYWPIRYLAKANDQIRVVQLTLQVRTIDEIKSIMKDGGFAVGFSDGAMEGLFKELGSDITGRWVGNYAGQPILKVWSRTRPSAPVGHYG